MAKRSCGQALSPAKRRKLAVLLEDLSNSDDIPIISQHTSMVFSQMQNQNLTIIPQLMKHVWKQSEPLVLEITEPRKISPVRAPPVSPVASANQEIINNKEVSETVTSEEIQEELVGEEILTGGIHSGEDVLTGEKQFEIIFSDSTRQTGDDSHIIHSTLERSGGSVEEHVDNLPNSLPLFQIVHTGQVPEDVQNEIVRLIRQANPELDLSSITFKFKSPETVEIIANINS